MSDEPYLLVEDVAARLGLPLSVLLRRVEAGDVPSRRVERADGMHYALRLSDLGIETGDGGHEAGVGEHEPPDDDEPEGISVFDGGEAHLVDDEAAAAPSWSPGGAEAGAEPAASVEEPAQPHPEHQTITPAWSTRPVEPRRPPEWITAAPLTRADAAEEGLHAEESPPAEPTASPELSTGLEPTSVEPAAAPAAPAPSVVPEWRQQEPMPARQAPEPITPEPVRVEAVGPDVRPVAPPPAEPQRTLPASTLLDPLAGGPRTDLASMSLDARDLVAGLLDRWERTLEQRIYTEQRQRFQVELTARQNMVKELQMELQTARAEHAAAQAEKDRLLAEKERQLAERERDLADTRRYVEESERGGPTSPEARRRRWFRPRGDD